MLYSEFQGKKLSLLGFGAMRLPLLEDKSIDAAQTEAMVRYAMAHGVNYFDTAYPYHNGLSEVVLGECLRAYPRDSFYLADKYPGHQIAERYDPAEIFEEQLKKCQVSYFDFYLLHNVYENSIKTYTDPQWGIMDYFVEQKKQGRIRHLGISSHGGLDVLRQFLDLYGEHLEFCQIQLNYLDWTLQDAKAKYDLLTERGIPVWVMEPVRGGKLAQLPEADAAKLTALRPEESAAAWAFRWLQGLPNVKMILSGMSAMAQMEDNVKTFEDTRPLTEAELQLLETVSAGLHSSIPCTACRYCCDGCPAGLDIPSLLGIYNDLRFAPSFTVGMRIEGLPEDKRPAACLACHACEEICPQKIEISAELANLTEALKNVPSWEAMCRERAEAAARLRAQQQSTGD